MWTLWTLLSLLILMVLVLRTRILRTLAPELCIPVVWELGPALLGLWVMPMGMGLSLVFSVLGHLESYRCDSS